MPFTSNMLTTQHQFFSCFFPTFDFLFKMQYLEIYLAVPIFFLLSQDVFIFCCYRKTSSESKITLAVILRPKKIKVKFFLFLSLVSYSSSQLIHSFFIEIQIKMKKYKSSSPSAQLPITMIDCLRVPTTACAPVESALFGAGKKYINDIII